MQTVNVCLNQLNNHREIIPPAHISISSYPSVYHPSLREDISFNLLVYLLLSLTLSPTFKNSYPFLSLSLSMYVSFSISSWWKYSSFSIPHLYLLGMNFNILLYLNRYSFQRMLTFYYPSVYPSRQKFFIPSYLVYPSLLRNEVYLIPKQHVTILHNINYSLSDICSVTSERIINLMENIVT